jgi:hypothetical protein
MGMKVYLDNNVVSAIARDDTAPESDALDRLLAAYDEGKVDLVTSDLSLGEIKQYVGSGRKLTERTFNLLKKVPVPPWDELLGVHSYGDAYTWINSPLIQSDELYASFLGLGLKAVDARHLLWRLSRAATCSSRAMAAFWRERRLFDGCAS